MPIIPTFDAEVGGFSSVVSQPTATADTSVSDALLSLGKVSQDIGNSLAEVRDKMQITQGQLDLEAAQAELYKSFEQDTDYGTQRERFAEANKKLVKDIAAGMSDSAGRFFTQKSSIAVQREQAVFDSMVTKREFAFLKQKAIDLIPQAANDYVYAVDEKSKAAGRAKVETVFDSVKDTFTPEQFAKFRSETWREIELSRGVLDAQNLGNIGKKLDIEPYKKFMPPDDIARLVKANQTALNQRSKQLATYKSEAKKEHDAEVALTGNTKTGYYEGLAVFNDQEGIRAQQEEDKINLAVNHLWLRAGAENLSGNMQLNYLATQDLIHKSNLKPSQKIKYLDKLETAHNKAVSQFNSDPMQFAVTEAGASIERLPPEGQITSLLKIQDDKGKNTEGYERKYFTEAARANILARYEQGNTETKLTVLTEVRNQYGRHTIPALMSIGINAGAVTGAEFATIPNAAQHSTLLIAAAETKKSDIAITPDLKKELDQGIAKAYADDRVMMTILAQSQENARNNKFIKSNNEVKETFEKLVYMTGSVDKALKVFNDGYNASTGGTGRILFPKQYNAKKISLNMTTIKSTRGLKALLPFERLNLERRQYEKYISDVQGNSKWMQGDRDTIVLTDLNGKPYEIGKIPVSYSMDYMQKASLPTFYESEAGELVPAIRFAKMASKRRGGKFPEPTEGADPTAYQYPSIRGK